MVRYNLNYEHSLMLAVNHLEKIMEELTRELRIQLFPFSSFSNLAFSFSNWEM